MPPTRTPLRLAILEADTPIGRARAKYGSYGGVFTSLLHRAADASHVPRERLEITGWDVVDGGAEEEEGEGEGEVEDMGGEWAVVRRKGYPRMRDVDAVLITGSRRWSFSLFVFWLGGVLRRWEEVGWDGMGWDGMWLIG